jgi:hypothetical protein
LALAVAAAGLIVMSLLLAPRLDWGIVLTAAVTVMCISTWVGVRQWLEDLSTRHGS